MTGVWRAVQRYLSLTWWRDRLFTARMANRLARNLFVGTIYYLDDLPTDTAPDTEAFKEVLTYVYDLETKFDYALSDWLLKLVMPLPRELFRETMASVLAKSKFGTTVGHTLAGLVGVKPTYVQLKRMNDVRAGVLLELLVELLDQNKHLAARRLLE